jgi:hypothetical protein
MFEFLMAVLAFWGSGLGFIAMALSQERHWERVSGLQTAQRVSQRALAVAGLVLQVCALGLMLRSQGPSFGSLMWTVMLSATAMAVAFMLSYKPHWLKLMAAWAVRESDTSHELHSANGNHSHL